MWWTLQCLHSYFVLSKISNLQAAISNIASVQNRPIDLEGYVNIMKYYVMKRNSSLHVPCPLGKCGEGSLCPHAVRVALATDTLSGAFAQNASTLLSTRNRRAGRFSVDSLGCLDESSVPASFLQQTSTNNKASRPHRRGRSAGYDAQSRTHTQHTAGK